MVCTGLIAWGVKLAGKAARLTDDTKRKTEAVNYIQCRTTHAMPSFSAYFFLPGTESRCRVMGQRGLFIAERVQSMQAVFFFEIGKPGHLILQTVFVGKGNGWRFRLQKLEDKDAFLVPPKWDEYIPKKK